MGLGRWMSGSRAKFALTVSGRPRYIRGGPAASAARALWRSRPIWATRARASEVDMLGEGEGLELLGVFITFILGLGVMVVLGKWWEA